MIEFKPGEMIHVRDSEDQTWMNRYFVAYHPFNDKIVTVDRTGVFKSWFRFKKMKSK